MKKLQHVKQIENFALSTTIKERIAVLQESKYQKTSDLTVLKKWRSRRTLLDEEGFQTKLAFENVDIHSFNRGIESLTTEDKKKLFEYVKQEEWFLYLNQLLDRYDPEADGTKPHDFKYALRYFVYGFKQQIQQILQNCDQIQVTSHVLSLIEDAYYQELMTLAAKTFVHDLHDRKQKQSFSGVTSEERFVSYLEERFGKEENVLSFLCEYPTLTKLLTYRTQFFVQNMKRFFQHITDQREKISQVFHFNGRWEITAIQIGAGDSHEQGKAVILFTLDQGLELVYKPKNLEIAQKYDQFLNWLERKESAFQLLVCNKIVTPVYAIEECIAYKACTSKKEVERFYTRFGYLLGIAYFLRGTDLHFENLIAHGEYPVLIDVETLFQHEVPVEFGIDAFTETKWINHDSIIMTGLLPFISYAERSESGKGIDFSALCGDEQQVPYKILMPTNLNSDQMSFSYQDYVMEGSQNVPMLHEKKVKAWEYRSFILQGFEEMLLFFKENKIEIVDIVMDLFKGIQVRNVLKGTQRYGDLLKFSYHPTCTQDWKEREKLFENSWAYSYRNKEVILHENEELLIGDIPIFYNRTDSTDILTGTGKYVKDFYEQTALEKSIHRMQTIDDHMIQKQMSHVKVSLGLQPTVEPLEFRHAPYVHTQISKEWLLEQAIHIADDLVQQRIVARDQNTATWNGVNRTPNGTQTISPLTVNLSDGLAGMLLYFSTLYEYTHISMYQVVMKQIENQIFSQLEKEQHGNAFIGQESILYPFSLLYARTGKPIYAQYMETQIEKWMQTEYMSSPEWLYGPTSMIINMVNLYQLTQKEKYREYAELLGERLQFTNSKQAGFTQGYAGAAYAWGQINSITKRKGVFDSKALAALEQDQRLFAQAHKNKANVWPESLANTGIHRIHFQKHIKQAHLHKEIEWCYQSIVNQPKQEDTLLTGNAGDLEFLFQYYQLYSGEKDVYEVLLPHIQRIWAQSEGTFSLPSFPTFPSVGIFTGLAGIGYTLLRIYDAKKAPNILYLNMM
ncbi:type 2 lanthipeptide synthetase LanM [Bacillus thuringiensis]|uniref:type 2 lanthipeptide synthetase LanM n=1 Tax=Bacillus thuringiensis TaxID=1428 RepID=UPI001FAC70F4